VTALEAPPVVNRRGPVGGLLADRLGWRRASAGGNLAAALAVGAIPLLHAMGLTTIVPLSSPSGAAWIGRALVAEEIQS
jgi:hypothetical protein